MSPATEIDTGLFDTYLALLGLAPEPPTYDFLSRLVRAHLNRIPFENISKLLYSCREGLKGLPGLEKYLVGARTNHFGGTCYSNNHYLYLLLRYLGFDAELNGADMQNLDVHIVIRVTLEERQFFVDVGYAAPFLDPLPADLKSDFEVELGISRYVLRPRDTEGRSRMDLFRNGELTHSYLAKPIPRDISFFTPAIVDSYREHATFMNSLLLTRYSEEHSVVIYNYTLTEYNGRQATIHRIKDKHELFIAIEQYFGIPQALADEALQGIDLAGNAWS